MSTINDMGIPGVGTGILQPKQKFKWRVTFANMGGNVDTQPLSMQCVTSGRPSLTYAETELHRYNSRSWIAGKYSFDPITIAVEDDISGTASSVIQSQNQSQQWLIGVNGQWLATASEGSLYKFVTYLDMLDGNDQSVETWVMEGCWFKSVKYGDLDYSNNDAVKIEMEIRFDMAHQIIGGYVGPGSALGGAGSTG